MKATELAWAAGFFDGEGNVNCRVGKRRQGWSYCGIGASIAQVDRRVLDKFKRAVGFGNVSGPCKMDSNPKHSPQFFWKVGRVQDVERVFYLLFPYLCKVKIAQFRDALKRAKQYRAGTHDRRVEAGRTSAKSRGFNVSHRS